MTVKVHMSDGDTDHFNIVAGVLREDTLALYLFIYLSSVFQMSRFNERKQLHAGKKEAEDTPCKLLQMQTMLLANTPA